MRTTQISQSNQIKCSFINCQKVTIYRHVNWRATTPVTLQATPGSQLC